jgi:hypothetical protein
MFYPWEHQAKSSPQREAQDYQKHHHPDQRRHQLDEIQLQSTHTAHLPHHW